MDALRREAQELFGLKLSKKQLEAFQTYASELSEWNQRVNLTAIRKTEEVRVKHFLDSLSCSLAMGDLEGARVVDVGSGAGFPGLPLKIAYPEMRLTLVESVGKKVAFCDHLVQVLHLEDVLVVNDRAERIGRQEAYRESCDWALARAVAPLAVLAEYLLPLVRLGGSMLAQKGADVEEELEAAETAFNVLGGELREIMAVKLPGEEVERRLVVVEKVAETPGQYPRRVGIPAKRPLSSQDRR